MLRYRRDFGDRLGDPCFLAFKGRDMPCPDCAAQRTFKDGRVHTGDETVFPHGGTAVQVVETAAPAAVEISPSDIERGYVESTATYRVRSNDPRGFLVQVRPRTARVEAVQLGGGAQSIALGDDGIELHRPWQAGAQEIMLRIRVRLDQLVRPGRMELPVHVTFAAL